MMDNSRVSARIWMILLYATVITFWDYMTVYVALSILFKSAITYCVLLLFWAVVGWVREGKGKRVL